ncbi:MAG: metallopeptidase TldD-related protein [Rhizobiaceae bacterium]
MSDSFDMLMLQDRAAALVEAANRAGADACDAVVAASRSTGVEVRDGELEETEGAENNAFSLRAFVGQRSASVSANMTGDPAALAERVVAMAKASPENKFAGLAGADMLATELVDLDLYDDTAPDFDAMQDMALACEAAALEIDGVSKSSGASFGRTLGGSVLATSEGFVGSYRASRFGLSVSVVAGDGTAMERDYDFDSQRHLKDLRSAQDIGAIAGQRAARRVNPRQVDTQTASVVFDPRIARGLVSHFAGAINGSAIVRGTSMLKDSMDQSVFATGVTIVDEPHVIRGMSSRPFDAEGVCGASLKLADDGVLKSWLLDSTTGRELGLASNGRAGRAGSGTSPGSTNLTMLAGNRSPKEMISNIKSGFYATELIGQGVNLITGDYSRGASGFWIEDGELTFPVSEITIAGNLKEMFAAIEPANDLDRRFGTNAPSILIEGLTIAGR